MGCLLFAFLSHTFLVLHKPLPDAVHSLNKRIRWNFYIYWFPLRFTDRSIRSRQRLCCTYLPEKLFAMLHSAATTAVPKMCK